MELKDKVALVTGGTKGIGAAAAARLAKKGMDVAILGRHDNEEARAVVTAIEAAGRKGLLITGDMAVRMDADRAVSETADKLGGLDVLVHSAGGPAPGSLMSVPEKDWYLAFDVHVHASFHLSRAAVPRMRERGGGSIVLISSVAGIRGVPGILAYCTVKGALPQMARAMARDLAEDNIRVNTVQPGIIMTDFHAQMTEEQKRHNLDNRIPLHRFGTPEEVADVIVLLAENDYITGESYCIDGGLTMRIA